MLHALVDMVPSLNPHVVDSPIKFEAPVYGESHPTFTDFVAPGIMVSITFAQAIGLTALAFIIDAKEGLLDRCWAVGCRSSEVILAHVATQFIVLVIQIGLVLVFALVVRLRRGEAKRSIGRWGWGSSWGDFTYIYACSFLGL